MRFTPPPISGKAVAAAFGAGLAAALMTIVSARQTTAGFASSGAGPIFISIVMGFISPLAIMIAAIGFGNLAGALAALVGGLAIGAFDLIPAGHAALESDKLISAALEALMFLVSQGVPAWLLGRIAVVGTGPVGTGPVQFLGLRKSASPPSRPEERVLGLITSVAIGFAALGIALAFVLEVVSNGGFAAFMTTMVSKVEPVVQPLLDANKVMFKDMNPHTVASAVVWGAMPLLAARAVIILVVNLWLAARIAQTSALLPVPWPDVPRHLRVPRPLALLLAVALGLAFAGGLVGMVSLIVGGALAMGFVLQGLAIVHTMTRGNRFRSLLLGLMYFSLVPLPILPLFPWAIISLGTLGLLDAAFAFRDRQKPIVKKIKP